MLIRLKAMMPTMPPITITTSSTRIFARFPGGVVRFPGRVGRAIVTSSRLIYHLVEQRKSRLTAFLAPRDRSLPPYRPRLQDRQVTARERGFKPGSLQIRIANLRAGDCEIGEGARQIRRIENRTSSNSVDSQSLSASVYSFRSRLPAFLERCWYNNFVAGHGAPRCRRRFLR